jgi:hypothetical protein
MILIILSHFADVCFPSWLCRNALAQTLGRIGVLSARDCCRENASARLITVNLERTFSAFSNFRSFHTASIDRDPKADIASPRCPSYKKEGRAHGLATSAIFDAIGGEADILGMWQSVDPDPLLLWTAEVFRIAT